METPEQNVPSATSDEIGVKNDGQQPAPEGSRGGDERAGRFADRIQTLRLEKPPMKQKPSRGRRWLLLLSAAAIIAGGVYAYQSDALYKLGGPVEVESIKVDAEQLLDVALDTTGTLVVPNPVDITPQVAGKVIELNLDVNKSVKKGELLLRIDPGQYGPELLQAKAGLAAAEARLDEAQAGARNEDVRQAKAALDQAKAQRDLLAKELQRAKKLENAISEADRDQIEANFREAEANVDRLSQALAIVELGPRKEKIAALKAEVERAKGLVGQSQFYFDCTSIHSPIDGTVLRRSVELGEVILVQPGIFATSIASIADLSSLEVEIEIQERDLAAIRVGQTCLITADAYPDRRYRGRLDRLAPTLSRERGSRQADIVLDSPDELLAGNMNCRVQVLKKEPPKDQQDVFRVPEEAVVKQGDGAFLFVANEGTARRLKVRLGAAEDGKVQIIEGLHGGEEVLLPGDRSLEEGQPIRTRPRNSPRRS